MRWLIIGGYVGVAFVTLAVWGAVYIWPHIVGVTGPKTAWKQLCDEWDEPAPWFIFGFLGLAWPLTLVGTLVWLIVARVLPFLIWLIVRRHAIITNGLRKLNGGNLP